MLSVPQTLRPDSVDEGLFIREAHHRIANSLQLASSFLRVRAHRASNHEIRSELAELASRIAAAGLIHHRLCQRDENGLVNVNDYVQMLCSEIGASVIGANGAEFRFDAGGEVVYLRARAVTLVGIILTELLTNCAKHAGDRPVCLIAISKRGAFVSITVSDNGPGFGNGHSLLLGAGIGLGVVDNFVSQLKGTLGLTSSARGAHLELTVPVNP
jgi:two-component sensor histidine kinase